MAETNAAQSGWAELNGARIYYEAMGAGQPLVLVHAGIADRRMWDEQFQALARHGRVIRYDMRGFGKTPMVDETFSHRRDLHALLDFLKVEQACLVGCSKGGATILDFALEHPERVKALVLVGATPRGYTFQSEPPRQWAAMEAAFRRRDLERASELEVQIWVDGPSRTPEQVDAALRDRVREMNLIALQTEAQEPGEEQFLEPAAAGRLSEIQCPALVVVGDLDNPKIVSAGRLLAEQVPGAKMAIMSGTAHVPNMEQPEIFNQIVLDFLREHQLIG